LFFQKDDVNDLLNSIKPIDAAFYQVNKNSNMGKARTFVIRKHLKIA